MIEGVVVPDGLERGAGLGGIGTGPTVRMEIPCVHSCLLWTTKRSDYMQPTKSVIKCGDELFGGRQEPVCQPGRNVAVM